MGGLVRTIIADDHAFIREGLKQLLSTVDELTVSGEAADGEAVHRLLNESSADLLILDLGMPGVSGFQFIASLRTGRSCEFLSSPPMLSHVPFGQLSPQARTAI